MVIIVDIDNTICTQESDYSKAQPLPERIAKINALYDAGNTIIYYTSRGMTSGKDYYSFTVEQLLSWGCKFNSVQMSKRVYDLWIDDKAINPKDL